MIEIKTLCFKTRLRSEGVSNEKENKTFKRGKIMRSKIKTFLNLRKESDIHRRCLRLCEDVLSVIISATESYFKTDAYIENGLVFKANITLAHASDKYDGVRAVFEADTDLEDSSIPRTYGEYLFHIKLNVLKAHKLGKPYDIDVKSVPVPIEIRVSVMSPTHRPIRINTKFINDKFFDVTMPAVPESTRYEISKWFETLKSLESFEFNTIEDLSF